MTHTEKIELRRGSLSFVAFAAGAGPLVLCLHGFPDNARSFRHQMPRLAEAGYRAVSVTLRGYEPASQADRSDYSLAMLAEDVFACSWSGWTDGVIRIKKEKTNDRQKTGWKTCAGDPGQ